MLDNEKEEDKKKVKENESKEKIDSKIPANVKDVEGLEYFEE